MKIKNIHIGNDILLKLTLKSRENRDYDWSNIKLVRCYFVNTSIADQEPVFVGEIPPAPFHNPDRRRFDICGPHTYHFGPWNAHWDGHCFDWHDHWFQKPGCHHRPPHPYMTGTPDCHWQPFRDINLPYDNLATYAAGVRVLEGRNRISTMFPAKDQLYCGTYKLIVVLITYLAGWGLNNLRTYTIDYGTVFNIVDEGGESGDITIDLNEDKPAPKPDPEPEKTYVICSTQTYTSPATSISVDTTDKIVQFKLYAYETTDGKTYTGAAQEVGWNLANAINRLVATSVSGNCCTFRIAKNSNFSFDVSLHDKDDYVVSNVVSVTATYKQPEPEKTMTITFSPIGGEYSTQLTVNISCSNPTASLVIYKTLNNNTLQSYAIGKTSINITSTCTIRVVATAVGYKEANASATYTIIPPKPAEKDFIYYFNTSIKDNYQGIDLAKYEKHDLDTVRQSGMKLIGTANEKYLWYVSNKNVTIQQAGIPISRAGFPIMYNGLFYFRIGDAAPGIELMFYISQIQ